MQIKEIGILCSLSKGDNGFYDWAKVSANKYFTHFCCLQAMEPSSVQLQWQGQTHARLEHFKLILTIIKIFNATDQCLVSLTVYFI